MSILSKVTKGLSGFNFSKTTSAVTTTTKKIDVDSFADAFKATSTKAAKNVDDGIDASSDVASSLKKFESQPGASAVLSRTAKVMANNPKLAALGVTTLAASGYIAFQMSQGLTFEEAVDKLVDVVGDTVEDATSKVADATTGTALVIVDSFLKGLLGENYLTYVKGVGILFVLFVLLRVFITIKAIVG